MLIKATMQKKKNWKSKRFYKKNQKTEKSLKNTLLTPKKHSGKPSAAVHQALLKHVGLDLTRTKRVLKTVLWFLKKGKRIALLNADQRAIELARGQANVACYPSPLLDDRVIRSIFERYDLILDLGPGTGKINARVVDRCKKESGALKRLFITAETVLLGIDGLAKETYVSLIFKTVLIRKNWAWPVRNKKSRGLRRK